MEQWRLPITNLRLAVSRACSYCEWNLAYLLLSHHLVMTVSKTSSKTRARLLLLIIWGVLNSCGLMWGISAVVQIQCPKKGLIFFLAYSSIYILFLCSGLHWFSWLNISDWCYLSCSSVCKKSTHVAEALQELWDTCATWSCRWRPGVVS